MKRLFLMLMLGSTMTAFAQVGEIALSFGDAKMSNNSLGAITLPDGSTTDLKAETNFRLGFRFTFNTYRFFGHELGFAYNRGHLSYTGTQLGMANWQGFYDFLAYALPEGSKVRPFAAGGVGFSTYYPPGTAVFSGNGITKFGLNYGGGVKFRVTDVWMVRFDVRRYTNPKPDLLPTTSGWLNQLEVSAGLAFAF